MFRFADAKLARAHTTEQIQIFFDAAIAIRALFPRLGQTATRFAHLFGG
jgi:hypothetical protein